MATVGMLNVLLELDSSNFRDGIRSASEKAQELGQNIRDVGSAMSQRLTAPIVAAGAAALASAVNVGNFADELLDLEQMTGISTDGLQRFRALSLEAGVATDTVASAVNGLNRRLASGEEGSGAMTGAMERLGVSLRDASGELRPMENIVEETIQALAGMENITERNAEAQRIFGGRARDLAPILGMGADAVADATARFDDLGIMMSGDALEAANEFRRDFDVLKATAGAVVREFGMAVLPVMQDFVALLQSEVIPRVRALVQRFQELGPQTQRTIAVVGALVAAIGPLLVALGTVIQVAGVVAGAIAALNPVVLAVIGVVAAMSAAWVLWEDEIRGAVDAVVGVVRRMSDTVGTVVRALVSLWTRQWEIVGSVIASVADVVSRIVTTLIERIQEVFRGGLGRVIEITQGAVEGVSNAFGWLYDRVVGNSIVPDMVDGVIGEFQRMEIATVDITQAATTKVSDSWRRGGDEIVEETEGITNRILRTFDNLGVDLPDSIRSPLATARDIWKEWGDDILDIVQNLWNKVKAIFDQMAEGAQGVPQFGMQGPAGFGPQGPSFGGGFGGAPFDDRNLWDKFTEGVGNILGSLLGRGRDSQGFTAVVQQVAISTDFLAQMLAERLDLVREDLQKLWETLWMATERIVQLPHHVDDILDALADMGDRAAEAAEESVSAVAAIDGLRDMIAGAASVVERAIWESADHVARAIASMAGGFGEHIERVDTRLSAQTDQLSRALDQMRRSISSLASGMRSSNQAANQSALPPVERFGAGSFAMAGAGMRSGGFRDNDGFLQSILDTTRAIERNQRTGAAGQGVTIQVMQQPGQSGEDLAELIAARVRELDSALGSERIRSTRDAGSGRVIA
ncbi:MAG: hypothetical protein EA417_01785 [Gammaproteobacteria bacterium]|nr:MAG: hypothetical protein EA417_01785 [Gammaproteobacteria bacterium]